MVPDYPMSEKTARDLLPVKREGNIDQSAIIEGARRLRNKLQEDGYFFTEITPVCTVTPPTPEFGENGTAATCETLNPETLSGRSVEIRYDIERGRRFKLTDIRITGTNKLTYDDVAADLKNAKSQRPGIDSFARLRSRLYQSHPARTRPANHRSLHARHWLPPRER